MPTRANVGEWREVRRHTTSRASVLGICALAFAATSASGCRTKAPVTFGVVLDSDGLRGATVAADDINAAGGIDGRRVLLRDVGGATSNKASVALATADALARDPAVVAVVGHTNSAASLAASQVYNASHVVQIAPTSSAPAYTSAGPYSFRMVASDIHQAGFLANHALAMNPRPRTAVLYVNDDYGRPLRDVVVDRLREGGLTLVHDAPFSEGASDATRDEMVTALARSRPELLLWLGRSYEYVPVVDTLRRLLPKLAVVASDGFSGGSVTYDSLHRLDGVRFVRLVNVERQDSAFTTLRARYLREGLGEPKDQAILAHDAIVVLAQAVRAVGPSREKVRDWLAKVGREVPAVAGASGPISFTTDGDREPAYGLETVGKARLDSARAATSARSGTPR